MKEVEKANLGIDLNSGKKIGGYVLQMILYGFVTLRSLQSVIDTAYGKWRLMAKVSKSAVMVLYLGGEWNTEQYAIFAHFSLF